MADLDALMDQLIDVGVKRWKLHLTVAMGNAVENGDLLMQPFELLNLMPQLAELHLKGLCKGILVTPGNNLGYFGPYEHLWRQGSGEASHWTGCVAGQAGMGLEADGTVKGCPSLPTNSYAVGNVRELPLTDIWADGMPSANSSQGDRSLWGYCGVCYYSDVCGGGCTWTAHSFLGRPGNNPYCHYRALALNAEGLRERVVKVAEADDLPFSTGLYRVVTERNSKGDAPGRGSRASFPTRGPTAVESDRGSGQSGEMALCRSCLYFVRQDETLCPFCGADISAGEGAYRADSNRRANLIADLEQTLPSNGRLSN
jgi:radical SAM protein with 4Fe4S-binding SPASM domain